MSVKILRNLTWLLLGIPVLWTMGCHSEPTPTNQTSSSSSSVSKQVAPSVGTPTLENKHRQRKQLAFSDLRGTTPIDVHVNVLQKRLQKHPESQTLLVQLGRAWVDKARASFDPGYYTHAQACAELVFEQDPNNLLAMGLQAQVLLNQHRFADARDLCEKIVAKVPDDLLALALLSDTNLELGRVPEAMEAAQRLVDLKPSSASLSRASYLRWIHGDLDGAKTLAKRALSTGYSGKNPEPHAWILVQSAHLFWHEGDWDGADAGYQRALSVFSDYPPALVGRGNVAMAHKKFSEAIDFYHRAYRQSPLVLTAWHLSYAYEANGNTKQAKEWAGKLESQGKREDHRSLSLYYSVTNQHLEQATKLCEQELQSRGDLYTLDACAWAYYRAKDFKKAIHFAEKAYKYQTPDARLMFHQGAILIQSKQVAKGQERIRAALQRNPAFDWKESQEASALLERTHPGGLPTTSPSREHAAF
jgi:tetratricopeptide (TPR) repeat protein